uniref:Putative GTPase n=1 Tax=Paulinella longichromatophora TaxID=1708747 RepID=A0A2H4ZNP6_9EUKA|nr:putative GTPase [Paulinella longichromatophora]
MSTLSTIDQRIPSNGKNFKIKPLDDYILKLRQWREAIVLGPDEKVVFESEIRFLDQQLIRLDQCYARVAVFGRAGVGKSSLLNALLGEYSFNTSIRHGSTNKVTSVFWNCYSSSDSNIELIDTPGVDETNSSQDQQIAIRITQKAELILFVIDSDLTKIDLQLLQVLISWEKPIILVLNRIDRYSSQHKSSLIKSIRRRLPNSSYPIEMIEVAAAPRRAYLVNKSYIRSFEESPCIMNLKGVLSRWFEDKGQMLLTLNTLQLAHQLNCSLRRWRLQQGQSRAIGIVNYYATAKALGILINPELSLDLIIVFLMDLCISLHLFKIYRLSIDKLQLKKIIYEISIHSAMMGIVYLSMQIWIKYLSRLLIASDLTLFNILHLNDILLTVIQVFLALYTSRSIANLVRLHLLTSSNLLPKWFKGSFYNEFSRNSELGSIYKC